MTAVATNDVAAAERRAERIRLRLDAIADNIDAVLPMIREAIEREDHRTLGYNGVSDYVQDRFGGALTRLPRDLRRPVVHELAAAGMSTRAIAPVVGAGVSTVKRDLQEVAHVDHLNRETGEVSDDYEDDEPPHPGLVRLVEQHRSSGAAVTPPPVERDRSPEPRSTITGLDGKQYARTEPKPRRNPLPEQARNAGWELRKAVERLERIAADDRFTANKEAMAPHLRSHLTNAIEVCQDLLNRIDN